MATLTVPKPITSGVPTVSHTAYNPAQAAFGANQNPQFSTNVPTPQQLFTGSPIPVGTILSQFNPPAKSQGAAPPAPTAYKAPNPYLVNQMLSALKTGGTVDPKTGWYGSAAQAMGKGGGGLQDFLMHKGVLDPASAQYAVDQFRQQMASGQITPGGGYGQWRGSDAPNPAGFWQGSGLQTGRPVSPAFQVPQTTNYYNPAFSQAGTMGVGTGKPSGSAFQYQNLMAPDAQLQAQNELAQHQYPK